MKSCYIYARVATEIQQKRGDSIEAQIKSLKNLAEDKNLAVKRVYWEVKSGIDKNRPELSKMLKSIKENKAKAILCTSLDRLSRNIEDLTNILKLAEEKRVRIVTPSRVYGYHTDGSFSNEILSLFSGYQKRMLSERVKRGVQLKKLQKMQQKAA
mgnify:CR=1 FL=1